MKSFKEYFTTARGLGETSAVVITLGACLGMVYAAKTAVAGMVAGSAVAAATETAAVVTETVAADAVVTAGFSATMTSVTIGSFVVPTAAVAAGVIGVAVGAYALWKYMNAKKAEVAAEKKAVEPEASAEAAPAAKEEPGVMTKVIGLLARFWEGFSSSFFGKKGGLTDIVTVATATGAAAFGSAMYYGVGAVAGVPAGVGLTATIAAFVVYTYFTTDVKKENGAAKESTIVEEKTVEVAPAAA